MGALMAEAQTLKARVALPPVRQEEDEGSPHFSALDATTVDADDEELPFNIAALALKRELLPGGALAAAGVLYEGDPGAPRGECNQYRHLSRNGLAQERFRSPCG
jgi:hypothetical protein